MEQTYSEPRVALNRIYTKGGDRGETSLAGGQRLPKDARRIEAYGTVDELNAALGAAAADLGDADLRGWVAIIQSSLFDLGSELATPGVEERKGWGAGRRVSAEDASELEGWIDALDTELEPLRNFILPGGTRAAGALFLACTVCRRAERRVVALAASEAVAPELVRYLNRLSDLLFTMARAVNHRARVEQPLWVGRDR
jgi:cob(I)alamin adenosyltransferase